MLHTKITLTSVLWDSSSEILIVQMFLFYFSLSPFLFSRNSENKISPLSLPSWQLYRARIRDESLWRERSSWLTIETMDREEAIWNRWMLVERFGERFGKNFSALLPSAGANFRPFGHPDSKFVLSRVLSRYVFLPKDDVPGPTDCRKGPLSGKQGWSGVKTVRMEKSVKRPCEKRGVLGVRNRIFTGVAPGRWRARAKSERVERNQREVEHTTREYTGRNDRRNFT